MEKENLPKDLVESSLSDSSESSEDHGEAPPQHPLSPATIEHDIENNAEALLHSYFANNNADYRAEQTDVRAYRCQILLPLASNNVPLASDNSDEIQIVSETAEGVSTNPVRSVTECVQRACRILHEKNLLLPNGATSTPRRNEPESQQARSCEDQASSRKRRRCVDVIEQATDCLTARVIVLEREVQRLEDRFDQVTGACQQLLNATTTSNLSGQLTEMGNENEAMEAIAANSNQSLLDRPSPSTASEVNAADLKAEVAERALETSIPVAAEVVEDPGTETESSKPIDTPVQQLTTGHTEEMSSEDESYALYVEPIGDLTQEMLPAGCEERPDEISGGDLSLNGN